MDAECGVWGPGGEEKDGLGLQQSFKEVPDSKLHCLTGNQRLGPSPNVALARQETHSAFKKKKKKKVCRKRVGWIRGQKRMAGIF